MNGSLRAVLCLTLAFAMATIGVIDLLSLGVGTCGAIADKLHYNCWGTLLLRSLTGLGTNVAAAVIDFSYAALALLLAFVCARSDED
jgi:hypothetical protein